MGMLGITINKKSKFSEIVKQYQNIQKKMTSLERYRPETRERFRDILTSQDNVIIPIFPFEEDKLYDLALHSDALRIGLNALRNRIFRRGTEIVQKTETADLIQEAKLHQTIEKINSNGQSIITLSENFEWDLDVQDNAYLIALKDYYFDFSGKIVDKLTTTKEIIRGSPTKIRLIADFQGNRGITPEGKKIYCAPDNRVKFYTEEQAQKLGFYDPDTGKELRQVFYRAEKEQGQYFYYYDEEVLFTSKHNPSLLYGYSNIFACWMKVLTLIYMDRFLMNAYRRGRPPRGLLTIGTTNYQSLKKAWEELKAKTREDPHAIEPLAYEVSQNNRGGSVNWIDLMKPLTEMQYIDSRNEFRRSIMALWGIMPLFAGDVQSSGGLNVESEQITVSDIAVERGQNIFNEKVYPWILQQFGITDYELKLREPEEQDEMEDSKVLQVKIDNAQKMRQMGFDVTYFPKEGDFEFSENPTEPQQGNGNFMPFLNSMQKDDTVQIEKAEFSELSKRLALKDKVAGLITMEKALIGEDYITKDLESTLIESLTKQIWDQSFQGMTKEASDGVKGILITGITERLSLNEVIRRITNTGIAKEKAETIARTEIANIQNNARIEMFKELDVKKVRWLGPNDNRTSDVCKEIKDKTAGGVTLDQLKKIIKDVAKKHGIVARDFVAHPNERHTAVPI